MGKLRTATILAGCLGIAAFFGNYTPLALSMASDPSVSRFVAQMVGSTLSVVKSTSPCWKMDAKSGCNNDLVETNAVQIDTAKCSPMGKGTLRVSIATGLPVRCGKPLALHNITLQAEFMDGERKPSSTNETLYNFDEAAIMINPGSSVHYDNKNEISQITLAEHLNNQTVFGSAHVEQQNGGLRIQKAHLTTYQNVLHLIGKSELKDLVFNDSCCTPVAGTIQTRFEAGQNVAPTELGAAFVGKTESLTFDGCGSAQLHDTTGHRTHIPVECL